MWKNSCSAIFFSIFIILLLENAVGQEGALGHWGYEVDDGPSNWCQMFPTKQCCGQHQSPINIITHEAIPTDDTLELHDYDGLPTQIKLTNNGHSAVVTMTGMEETPYVKLLSKDEKCTFNSLHFHWGLTDYNGSEHTIDGHRGAFEMHLVHVNSMYNSLAEAMDYPNGIMVVSFLFGISDEDNEHFEFLIKTLNSVEPDGSVANVQNEFSIASLFSNHLTRMFSYQGSLTTPPCSEAVTWFVNEKHLFISERQIDDFRKLEAEANPAHPETHTTIKTNFRSLQPLNDRHVYFVNGEIRQ